MVTGRISPDHGLHDVQAVMPGMSRGMSGVALEDIGALAAGHRKGD